MMVANMDGPGKGCESRCKLWGVYSLLYGDRGAFTGHGMLVMILGLQHWGTAFGLEQLFVVTEGNVWVDPVCLYCSWAQSLFSINFRKPDFKSLKMEIVMDIIVNYCLPTAFREIWSDQRAFSGEAKAKQVCSQAGNEDLGQMEPGRWREHEGFYDNIDKWNANGFYHVSI